MPFLKAYLRARKIKNELQHNNNSTVSRLDFLVFLRLLFYFIGILYCISKSIKQTVYDRSVIVCRQLIQTPNWPCLASFFLLVEAFFISSQDTQLIPSLIISFMYWCQIYTIRRIQSLSLLQKESDWPWLTKIMASGVCHSTNTALSLCLLMVTCYSTNSTSDSLRSSVAWHSIGHSAPEKLKHTEIIHMVRTFYYRLSQ